MLRHLAVLAAVGAALASITLASAATPAAPGCPATVGTATLVHQQVLQATPSRIRVLCFYRTADGQADQNADMSVEFEPKNQSTKEPFLGCGYKDTTEGVFESSDYYIAGQLYYEHATQDFFLKHSGPWKDAVLAFMQQAEDYARSCKAAAPTGARHTWSLSSRGLFSPHNAHGDTIFILTGVAGAGTLDVGANGEPTAARGSLGLTLMHYKNHAWLHYKLGVVRGASFQRSSGSVDRIVVAVKVLNLRTSSVECIADPDGTIELTDGNGQVPDTLVVRSVCGLGFTDEDVRINIR